MTSDQVSDITHHHVMVLYFTVASRSSPNGSFTAGETGLSSTLNSFASSRRGVLSPCWVVNVIAKIQKSGIKGEVCSWKRENLQSREKEVTIE